MLQPGHGLQVLGQRFGVSAADLAAMDRLERVGDPQGYGRVRIEVEQVDDGHVFEADVCAQQVSRLDGYTPEHSQQLRG